MNIPTVDELVKVFKDNNWTPHQTSGANLDNVLNGRCCILPALIKYYDPDFDFSSLKNDEDIYNMIKARYSNSDMESLYRGFDSICNPGENQEFYNLGKELYEKLTNE